LKDRENGLKAISDEDRKKIESGLRDKYVRVAVTPENNFQYPTGKAGLEGQHYDLNLLKNLPDHILASYCGVGNPFTLGPITEGQSVLDVGCGAGVDTLIAAMMVGPRGKAAGIDVIPEMLERARDNLRQTDLDNVTFHHVSVEDIPFPEGSFDVVISNGVFNLIPDKDKALREVFRVLKPSGRLQLADQILTIEPTEDMTSRIDNWAG
jgi:SAM-dependent methyltransferase